MTMLRIWVSADDESPRPLAAREIPSRAQIIQEGPGLLRAVAEIWAVGLELAGMEEPTRDADPLAMTVESPKRRPSPRPRGAPDPDAEEIS